MEEIQAFNAMHKIDQSFIDAREEKLASAYIETATKRPDTFIDLISPEDEMYIFTREKVGGKAIAKYLYLADGKECLDSLAHIMRSAGKSFSQVRAFLDFACGHGRMTRFLVEEIEPQRIWVSDIYKDAVDFQKKSFGVNGFFSETEPSRLKFPRTFDVIYVGSLFSHLPANRFEAWLSSLYSVLDDDGIMIFSTHGEWICDEAQRDPSGFTYMNLSESRSLSTVEYGASFVKRQWVESLSKKLSIANIYCLERELTRFQDMYLVTKKGAPLVNELAPRRYVLGNIDRIQITPDGEISIEGWAIGKGRDDPVKEVCVYANNQLLGQATLGIPRSDVEEQHFGRAGCLNSGWKFSTDGSVLENVISEDTGLNIIRAMVRSASNDVTYLVSSC